MADPFLGEPLIVRIHYSGSESPRGWFHKEFQDRTLVVIVRHSNGKQAGKIVAIPPRNLTQTITVEVP